MLWHITQVAEHWHVTPRVAADELYEDPMGLAITCLTLSRYAEAYQAYKAASGSPKKGARRQLDAWRSTPGGARLIDAVEENDFALVAEEMKAARGR